MSNERLKPQSYNITTTGSTIDIKKTFNSQQVVLIPQNSDEPDLFVALNPNSTEVRTTSFQPTITGIIGNQYDVTDSGSVTLDDVEYPYYTPTDPLGIIVGEEVTIDDGTDTYVTTVHSIDSGDIILEPIEDFTPANTDILIFNHSTWYFITSSIGKIAVGDKFKLVLDDDASIQELTVSYKDATHFGFIKSGDNYTSSDVATFESDFKLSKVAIKLESNDYSSGLLVKHLTQTTSTVNLSIVPFDDYNLIKSLFF